MPSHGNDTHRRNSLITPRTNTRFPGQNPRNSSNKSEITNDHLSSSRNDVLGDKCVAPPSSSNMHLCASPMSSPCRRSRTDHEEEEECFTMVANKRRRNQDKNFNLDVNRESIQNAVVDEGEHVDVLKQPPFLRSTTDMPSTQPKHLNQPHNKNHSLYNG